MFEKALKVLRLKRGADREQVRRAYVKMSRRYPPEHFPAKFKQIKDAYEQLSLNWDLTENKAKELSSSESFDQFMQNIVEEALQEADSQADGNKPEALDIWTLEPIANVAEYNRQVLNILEEIKQEQGIGDDRAD